MDDIRTLPTAPVVADVRLESDILSTGLQGLRMKTFTQLIFLRMSALAAIEKLSRKMEAGPFGRATTWAKCHYARLLAECETELLVGFDLISIGFPGAPVVATSYVEHAKRMGSLPNPSRGF